MANQFNATIERKQRLAERAAKAKEEAQACFNCKRDVSECNGGSVASCGVMASGRMTVLIQDYAGYPEPPLGGAIITKREYDKMSKALVAHGVSQRKKTMKQAAKRGSF